MAYLGVSGGGKAGVPENVIMAIAGWKTPSIFRRYSIVDDTDTRVAMERLGEYEAKARHGRAALARQDEMVFSEAKQGLAGKDKLHFGYTDRKKHSVRVRTGPSRKRISC